MTGRQGLSLRFESGDWNSSSLAVGFDRVFRIFDDLRPNSKVYYLPDSSEWNRRSGWNPRSLKRFTCINSVADPPRYYCSYRDLQLLQRSIAMELIPSFAAFRFRTFVGRFRSTRSNSPAATFIPEIVEPESCPLSLAQAMPWCVLRSAVHF